MNEEFIKKLRQWTNFIRVKIVYISLLCDVLYKGGRILELIK